MEDLGHTDDCWSFGRHGIFLQYSVEVLGRSVFNFLIELKYDRTSSLQKDLKNRC